MWRFSIVVTLVFAFLMRIHNLVWRPLWFDEAIEYWMATSSIPEIHISVSRATHDPPFYSYILHLWQGVDDSEFWLRILSLFFSVLAVACVMRLGRDAAGRPAAIIGGLLIAVSAADIRYAQEVGQYSLMVFLVAANTILLQIAYKRNTWRNWIAWGILSAIAIYTHYGAVIVVAATAGAVFVVQLARRDWSALWRQGVIGAVTVVGLLPLVIYIIPYQLNRLGASALPINLSDFLNISRSIILFQFMGNQGAGWPWPQLPMMLVWVPAIIATALALRNAKSVIAPSILLFVAWLTYYLISRTGSYFFAGTRHSLLIAPLFYATVAGGLVKMQLPQLPNVLRYAGGALAFAILMLTALAAPLEGREELRAMTRYLVEHRTPDEAVYVYYGAVPGFRYHMRQATGVAEDVPPMWYVDCMGGTTAPHCVENNIFYGRWVRSETPPEKYAYIVNLLGPLPERLWLVFSHVHSIEHEVILDQLSAEYNLLERHNDSAETVMLLQRKADAER